MKKRTKVKTPIITQETGALFFVLPQEREAFEAAQRGDLFKWRMQELDEWLKVRIEYSKSKIQITELDDVRNRLHEICDNELWD